MSFFNKFIKNLIFPSPPIPVFMTRETSAIMSGSVFRLSLTPAPSKTRIQNPHFSNGARLSGEGFFRRTLARQADVSCPSFWLLLSHF
jgi:hypothetical protein